MEDDPDFVVKDEDSPKKINTRKTSRKRAKKQNTSDSDSERKETRGRKPLHPDHEYIDKFINLNGVDKPIICKDCSKAFDSHCRFALHSKTHRDDDLYCCHLCDYKNNCKTTFKNHMISHDEYQCTKCNRSVKSKNGAYKHWKTHLVQVLVKCDICNKDVRASNLNNHKKMVHTDETAAMVQCPFCDKTYKNASALNSHYSSHHKELGVDKSVICYICGMRLSCKGSLGLHLRTHSGDKPFSCSSCPKTFVAKDRLIAHMRVHTGEKPFICKYCNKKFAHGSTYRYHVKTHTGEKAHKCPFCGKSFITRTNVRIHLKSCYPVK